MNVDSLKKKLQPIFEEKKVKKAILFGSFARGEASRHSDIDLILIQNTDLRFPDRYDGVLSAISQALPEWDVDRLFTHPPNWLRFQVGVLSSRHYRKGKSSMSQSEALYEAKRRWLMAQEDAEFFPEESRKLLEAE